MKKLTTYIILLLLVGITSTFAQDKQQKPLERSTENGKQEEPGILTEEQALLIHADDYNPAKIEESFVPDPKMNGADIVDPAAYGPGNAQAAPENMVEVEREEANSEPVIRSVQIMDKTQPEGEQHGTIVNYRYLPDGGNQQPDGEMPEHIQNFRDMNGANQQPPGDTPGK